MKAPLKAGSMAEGGKDEQENNPFSFKSFISKKDKKKDDVLDKGDDGVLDIFDTPDNASQRKRDKSRQILLVEDDAKEQPKKKGKSENPFSFKKFLSSSGSNVRPATSRKDSPSGKTVNSAFQNVASDVQVLPNIASDLPDFVQDHYCDSSSAGTAEKGLELPDFDLVSPSLPNSERVARDGRTSSFELPINSVNAQQQSSPDISDNELESDNQPAQSVGGMIQTLPDFLSDGVLSSSKNSPPGISVISDSVLGAEVPLNYREPSSELQRQQQENQDLRRQLDEERQKRRAETESIQDLQQQIVVLKKKEQEETAAMEKAIQQVEQNLKTTTKRAVHAETTVTKLKNEVKSLQAEIKSLRAENEIMRSGDKGLAEIKEKTNYVADQLSSAAKTAESSLKQLLSGVDNLKLLSQVLTSIDKISEEMGHDSQENHKKTFDDP